MSATTHLESAQAFLKIAESLAAALKPTGAHRSIESQATRSVRLVESAAEPATPSRTSQETIDELSTMAKQVRGALLPQITAAFNGKKNGRIDDKGTIADIVSGVDQWVNEPARDLGAFKHGEIVVARLEGIRDQLQRIVAEPTADGADVEAKKCFDNLVALVDVLACGERDGQAVMSAVQYQESSDAAVSRAREKTKGRRNTLAIDGASPRPSTRITESASDYESRFAESLKGARERIAGRR